MDNNYDVIIIGAGAAGMMCAIEAGKRGRSVLLLDHAKKPGEKIRISGGGRCNFTNIHTVPERFFSQNPHFCKSALSRYSPQDFIALVEKHGLTYHEKTLGQLFCDQKSQAIIDMLLTECAQEGVTIRLETAIESVTGSAPFRLKTAQDTFSSPALVIATGGPSIPKMGASGFAYDIARKYGLEVIEPQPALVPLTFTDELLTLTKALSGVSVDPVTVSCGKTSFREALLFTHRGLSGPAILQISSYWRPGNEITINLLPGTDMRTALKTARDNQPRQMLHTALAAHLPERLAKELAARAGFDKRLADLPDKKLTGIAESINSWRVKPNGSEGYRTAEVTKGGVSTKELSSKTFETKNVPGLYFIGEALDVTGWLGGYNFQWAWASGWCCGQAV